jgi:hypothetical protein
MDVLRSPPNVCNGVLQCSISCARLISGKGRLPTCPLARKPAVGIDAANGGIALKSSVQSVSVKVGKVPQTVSSITAGLCVRSESPVR